MSKKLRISGLIISIIVLVSVVTILVFQHYQRQQQAQRTADIADAVRNPVVEVEIEEPIAPEPEADIEEPELPEEVFELVIPIDFEYLWDINEDVHAWISIPGTYIDYPILQYSGSNQEFYLRRNIDRDWSLMGALFTQDFNALDFSDRVTIIYGHYVTSDSTKFGTLYRYLNADFMHEHREITIYTPNSILTFMVFGAFTFDDRHLMLYYDFEVDSHFDSFLRDIMEFRTLNQFWLDDIAVTAEDRIIILSTCVQRRDHRLLIGAVLIDEQIKE